MSVFLRWPDKLPLPLLKNHNIKPGNPLLETKMDSGYSRVRRKHQYAPDSMTVKHLFKADEAALFNGFYEHGLNGGVNQFVMPVLLPEGLIDHVVRFKPPIKSLKAQSKKLWLLDAVVLIERRFISSEENSIEWLMNDAGTTTAEFVSGVSNIVNELDGLA